jgi:uncharacterized RDD family membrane protein YckC
LHNKPPLREVPNKIDYQSNLKEPYFNLVPETPGQSFVNFFVDNLLMRFALAYVSGTIIGTIMALISPEFFEAAIAKENVGGFLLLAYFIGSLNYLVYYTLCEKLFRGYTLGKLVTGTRAIRSNGAELRFKDCLLRSFCRLVPLEVLSGFGGRPWHDSWTNTMVIKVK